LIKYIKSDLCRVVKRLS